MNLLAIVLLMLMLMANSINAGEQPGFQLNHIGHVQVQDGKSQIVLDPEYQDGLLRLDEFSHVWVIWWFDRNDSPEEREILQVHPRREPRNPLSGVFATRAPVRPNLVGLTLCRVIAVRENVLVIDRIDAYPGTPVLDLKPYIPGWESVPDAIVPQRY